MPQSVAPPFEGLGRGPTAAGQPTLATVERWLTAVLGVFRAGHGGGEAAFQRHLLVLRFGVVNTVAFALLAAAWLQGWIDAVLEGDGSRLVGAIAAVFLAGLALCTKRIVQTSRELNQIRELDLGRPCDPGRSRVIAYCRGIEGRDAQSRAIGASALRLKLSARIAAVRHIAGSLVVLGLIGTVIGFIVALSGVDPETAANVSAIGPMVSTLIDGMAIALHTTLVGAVLNVWLMMNYRLLEAGTVDLIAGIVERGERRHARS